MEAKASIWIISNLSTNRTFLPIFLKMHKVLKNRRLNPKNTDWFAQTIQTGLHKQYRLVCTNNTDWFAQTIQIGVVENCRRLGPAILKQVVSNLDIDWRYHTI